MKNRQQLEQFYLLQYIYVFIYLIAKKNILISMMMSAHGQGFNSMKSQGGKGFKSCKSVASKFQPPTHPAIVITSDFNAPHIQKLKTKLQENYIPYGMQTSKKKVNRPPNSPTDKNFIIVDDSKGPVTLEGQFIGIKILRIDYPNKHNIEQVIKQFDEYIGLGKQVIQENSEYQQFNYQGEQEQQAKQILLKIGNKPTATLQNNPNNQTALLQSAIKLGNFNNFNKNGTTAANNHSIKLKSVHQFSNGIGKSKIMQTRILFILLTQRQSQKYVLFVNKFFNISNKRIIVIKSLKQYYNLCYKKNQGENCLLLSPKFVSTELYKFKNLKDVYVFGDDPKLCAQLVKGNIKVASTSSEELEQILLAQGFNREQKKQFIQPVRRLLADIMDSNEKKNRPHLSKSQQKSSFFDRIKGFFAINPKIKNNEQNQKPAKLDINNKQQDIKPRKISRQIQKTNSLTHSINNNSSLGSNSRKSQISSPKRNINKQQNNNEAQKQKPKQVPKKILKHRQNQKQNSEDSKFKKLGVQKKIQQLNTIPLNFSQSQGPLIKLNKLISKFQNSPQKSRPYINQRVKIMQQSPNKAQFQNKKIPTRRKVKIVSCFKAGAQSPKTKTISNFQYARNSKPQEKLQIQSNYSSSSDKADFKLPNVRYSKVKNLQNNQQAKLIQKQANKQQLICVKIPSSSELDFVYNNAPFLLEQKQVNNQIQKQNKLLELSKIQQQDDVYYSVKPEGIERKLKSQKKKSKQQQMIKQQYYQQKINFQLNPGLSKPQKLYKKGFNILPQYYYQAKPSIKDNLQYEPIKNFENNLEAQKMQRPLQSLSLQKINKNQLLGYGNPAKINSNPNNDKQKINLANYPNNNQNNPLIQNLHQLSNNYEPYNTNKAQKQNKFKPNFYNQDKNNNYRPVDQYYNPQIKQQSYNQPSNQYQNAKNSQLKNKLSLFNSNKHQQNINDQGKITYLNISNTPQTYKGSYHNLSNTLTNNNLNNQITPPKKNLLKRNANNSFTIVKQPQSQPNYLGSPIYKESVSINPLRQIKAAATPNYGYIKQKPSYSQNYFSPISPQFYSGNNPLTPKERVPYVKNNQCLNTPNQGFVIQPPFHKPRSLSTGLPKWLHVPFDEQNYVQTFENGVTVYRPKSLYMPIYNPMSATIPKFNLSGIAQKKEPDYKNISRLPSFSYQYCINTQNRQKINNSPFEITRKSPKQQFQNQQQSQQQINNDFPTKQIKQRKKLPWKNKQQNYGNQFNSQNIHFKSTKTKQIFENRDTNRDFDDQYKKKIPFQNAPIKYYHRQKKIYSSILDPENYGIPKVNDNKKNKNYTTLYLIDSKIKKQIAKQIFQIADETDTIQTFTHGQKILEIIMRAQNIFDFIVIFHNNINSSLNQSIPEIKNVYLAIYQPQTLQSIIKDKTIVLKQISQLQIILPELKNKKDPKIKSSNTIGYIYFKDFNKPIRTLAKILKNYYPNSQIRKYFSLQDLPTKLPNLNNQLVIVLLDQVGFKDIFQYLSEQSKQNNQILKICIPKSTQAMKLCQNMPGAQRIVWLTEKQLQNPKFILKGIQKRIRG